MARKGPYAIGMKIACPAHQKWPFSGTTPVGVKPQAVLNLRNFEWYCLGCKQSGQLTKALSSDYELPSPGVSG